MITILSFGAGQDSTALLYMSVYDRSFQERYITGELIVIMSDTGNEYPETYQHILSVETFCKTHNIPFHFLTKESGYHGNTWATLETQMLTNKSIMSVALPRTCTDNLKIQPFYRFIRVLLCETYGYDMTKRSAFYQYAQQFGKLKIIIGFAAGEENRVYKTPQKPAIQQNTLFPYYNTTTIAADPRPKWYRETIEQIYPLIDLGMDRLACQQIIAGYGHTVPPPSNCMMCPFASEQEILYLYRFHRSEWELWVQHEKEKIQKNADRQRNLGVKGKILLPEILEIAQQKHGHMTNEELIEYRFSHGHCVKSKF